jgi:hypothetical protein
VTHLKPHVTCKLKDKQSCCVTSPIKCKKTNRTHIWPILQYQPYIVTLPHTHNKLFCQPPPFHHPVYAPQAYSAIGILSNCLAKWMIVYFWINFIRANVGKVWCSIVDTVKFNCSHLSFFPIISRQTRFWANNCLQSNFTLLLPETD